MKDSLKLERIRLIFTLIILVLLVFPFQDLGIPIPNFVIQGKIVIDLKYIISGIIFLVVIMMEILDFLSMKKEKNKYAFSECIHKILVNTILVLLSYQGFISVLVPIILISCDFFMNYLELKSTSKRLSVSYTLLEKIQYILIMSGIVLLLFYNLPFELWGIYIADILIYAATIFMVVTTFLHYIEFTEKIKVR